MSCLLELEHGGHLASPEDPFWVLSHSSMSWVEIGLDRPMLNDMEFGYNRPFS